MNQDVERWKKELQRRNGNQTVAGNEDNVLAREIIGNVYNYAEEDGQLSISTFGPLSDRIATALTTIRKEARAAAFKDAVVIINEQTTARKAISAIEAAANTEEGASDEKL